MFNIWLGVSATAKAEYKDRRDNPETYSGSMDDQTFNILSRIHDSDNVEKFFKNPTVGAHVRTMFSTYPQTNVQESLDYLEAQWPGHFVVAGAWHWDGRQIGTQWVDEEDHSLGTTGTPTYPINESVLLQFMPDVWNGDDPPTYSAPTELTDVNLLMGQAKRWFDKLT